MSNKYLAFDERLVNYIRDVSLREPEILRRLREETATHHQSQMQLLPEQGQFLAFLIELTGATRVLEIGTYTGYSALLMALALPAHGLVVTCDVNPETTAIAKRYWDEAGISQRIESKLGPALETLDEMLDEEDDYFDLVFIDADKANVSGYFERALDMVRRGGLIVVDNVLWDGKVADPLVRDEDTLALRGLNRKLRDDARVSLSLLPIGDGMTLARKR